jgi:hypothetical protein
LPDKVKVALGGSSRKGGILGQYFANKARNVNPVVTNSMYKSLLVGLPKEQGMLLVNIASLMLRIAHKIGFTQRNAAPLLHLIAIRQMK